MSAVTARSAVALALLLAVPAVAQDRPREDELFGGEKKEGAGAPSTPKSEGEVAAPAGAGTRGGPEGEGAHAPPAAGTAGGEARDEAVLGTPEAPPKLSAEVAPENPLVIGGQFYLRAQTIALEGQKPNDWTVSSPSLMDGYFDARPNPRVRGYLLARMRFDPVLQEPFAGLLPGGFDSGMGANGAQATPAARDPQVLLDQMWLRFDIKRTVFVTAGRQHVRWGTARFWTPTDFLHVTPRNPLDVFDARTGSTMLKLHVPWEERGWNFYAYGITEGAGPKLGTVAGAARAEVVIGTSELGLGALVARNRKPKLAADLSTGIGDIDLYGEVALRYGSEIDRVALVDVPAAPGATIAQIIDTRYPVYRDRGVKPQVTGGLSYSRRYADKDVWTLGGEYFYNALGYSDPAVYPGLLARSSTLSAPPSFFYLGRHYAAVFLALPAPYSWDLTSFTLSTIGNLSDRSFISRLDYTLTLLTHLRFEAFVAVHYGESNGEFRLGLSKGGRQETRLLDLGVALRMAL